jgi:hypothetical protein
MLRWTCNIAGQSNNNRSVLVQILAKNREHPVKRKSFPELDSEQVGQPDRVPEQGPRVYTLGFLPSFRHGKDHATPVGKGAGDRPSPHPFTGGGPTTKA